MPQVSKEVASMVAEGVYRVLASIPRDEDKLPVWKLVDAETQEGFSTIVKEVVEEGLTGPELLERWEARGYKPLWERSGDRDEPLPQQPPQQPSAPPVGEKSDEETDKKDSDSKDDDAELTLDDDGDDHKPGSYVSRYAQERSLGMVHILTETVKACYRCVTGSNV